MNTEASVLGAVACIKIARYLWVHMNFTLKTCDRVIRLENGLITYDGPQFRFFSVFKLPLTNYKKEGGRI